MLGLLWRQFFDFMQKLLRFSRRSCVKIKKLLRRNIQVFTNIEKPVIDGNVLLFSILLI